MIEEDVFGRRTLGRFREGQVVIDTLGEKWIIEGLNGGLLKLRGSEMFVNAKFFSPEEEGLSG